MILCRVYDHVKFYYRWGDQVTNVSNVFSAIPPVILELFLFMALLSVYLIFVHCTHVINIVSYMSRGESFNIT